MTKLVFANIDYEPDNGRGGHTTSEGMELQRGLEAAGWTLAGAGFGDGCRDAVSLIERHQPEFIFVSDKRDFDPNCGAFRKDVGFTRLGELARHHSIGKLAVVKDAGSMSDYHRSFCEEVRADAVVTYYHAKSVLAVSSWLSKYPLIRTYHTVNGAFLNAINMKAGRKKALVSGAQNANVYPLRQRAIENAHKIGVDVVRHPGYANRGNHTPHYLRLLAGYKVHVATASAYGFALRKIIESVAVGATPVTDLPAYDVLPKIDGALVRVAPDATVSELKAAVDSAVRNWDLEERMVWAAQAQRFYDFKKMGQRLSSEIAAKLETKVSA